MHDWLYVGVGYAVTVGGVLGYLWSIRRRRTALRAAREVTER